MSLQTTDGADYLPPRPVRLAPLEGKYYGTRIVDADGVEICKIWRGDGPPSPRESEGERYDSHYETVESYVTAHVIATALNAYGVTS